MVGYGFSHTPLEVPEVRTNHRQIVTSIPSPGSVSVLESLDQTESRSMHGQLPVVWHSARGYQVEDGHGNCWIDFTSTIFVTNVGHAHPHVKAAIAETLEQDLIHSYTYATEIRARYLERLIDFVPAPLEKAFLLSSGTEATECALKLARMYAQSVGKAGGIVSYAGSMHGRTLGAEMLSRKSDWIGYRDPAIHHLPFPYPWDLNGSDGVALFGAHVRTLEEDGVDIEQGVAAFFLESYLGWGAVLFPKDYVEALVDFARAREILVVFDEIQGGFGRTGKLFTYQHYGVEPDLVCCGKGMGSGIPLSAVLGRRELLDLPDVGSMSSTHSANPIACAAGLATIDVLVDENLIEESARKGALLFDRLRELQAEYPSRISFLLGKGLLAAVIVRDERGAPDGETASRISERAMQKGLLVVHTGRESIKLGPPLTIPDDALLEGLDVLAEAFEEIIG